MYAAIWYVMLRNFHWKVTLFCMVGLALVITIADQTGATLIRPYVERLRPSNLENPISDMVHIVNGCCGGCFVDFMDAFGHCSVRQCHLYFLRHTKGIRRQSFDALSFAAYAAKLQSAFQ